MLCLIARSGSICRQQSTGSERIKLIATAICCHGCGRQRRTVESIIMPRCNYVLKRLYSIYIYTHSLWSAFRSLARSSSSKNSSCTIRCMEWEKLYFTMKMVLQTITKFKYSKIQMRLSISLYRERRIKFTDSELDFFTAISKLFIVFQL